MPELAKLHSPSSLSNVSDESSEVSRAPAFATVFAPVASSVKAARNASSLQKRDGFVNAAHPASQDVAVSTTNQPSTAKTLEGLTATSKNMNRRNCIRNQARSCTQAMNSASSCSMAGATYARRCCSTSQNRSLSRQNSIGRNPRNRLLMFPDRNLEAREYEADYCSFRNCSDYSTPQNTAGRSASPCIRSWGGISALSGGLSAAEKLKGTMVALALLGKHKT